MKAVSVLLMSLLVMFSVTNAQEYGGGGFGDYDYGSDISEPTTEPEPEPVMSSTPSYSSSSDKKFSLVGALGWGFSVGGIIGVWGVPGGDFSSDTWLNGNLTEVDDDYANFGRGFKIDLGASYALMDNVNLMGAFVMSFAPRAEGVDESTTQPLTTNTIETITVRNAQLGLKVLLVPHFTIFDLLEVGIGAGLGLYFNPASYEYELETITAAGSTKLTEEGDIGTKASLPFIGTIVVEYPISSSLAIFLDLTYEAMNVTIDRIKADKSNLTTPTSVRLEKDATDRNPPIKVPASNLAIRLGVRIPLF